MVDNMKKLRRWVQGAPLFLPLLAVCGAIPGAWWWLVSVAAMLLPSVCRLWKIALCALLCSLVAGLHTSWCEHLGREFRVQLEEREVVEVCGMVERNLRRGCVLSTGWNGVRVVLRGDTSYTPGDVVRVRGQRQESHSPGVKGVFNSEAWMRGQGIAASLDFVEGEKLGKPLSWRTVQHWGIRMQERLARRLMSIGGESGAASQVLTSLVLGDKSGAESETMESFRNGGCLHAFAVSGLHVGLVSGILWMLLRGLRVRPVVIRPLVLLATGVYSPSPCESPEYLELCGHGDSSGGSQPAVQCRFPAFVRSVCGHLPCGACLHAGKSVVWSGFLHSRLLTNPVGGALEQSGAWRARDRHRIAERLAGVSPYYFLLFSLSKCLELPD